MREHGVLHGPHGVRAGWRIVLFLMLAIGFAFLAAMIAKVAGLDVASLDVNAAVVLVAFVAAGWIMLALVDRRPLGALGFAADAAAARQTAAGFAVGGGMQLLTVALLAVAGTARWVADDGTTAVYVATLARALALFAVAAAMEEAVFRGYFLQALVQGIGVWPAVLVTSALFSAGHLGNPNVTAISLANIFLAGVWLAVCYLRTRSLWFATAAHLAWNWVMSALLDFPVSGLVRDTPLYSARETGADWWTGGVFGPEGGLAATAVILAGTLWLLRTRAVGESPKMRELRPLVDDRLREEWPR
ncbi:MAG TPA: CPBP family intramembrane glutamic endopeptidase [Longimicrobium sp.]|nr:CPBP family intramembrane glutamic endopeptidase [Longimicrobium sp.]